MGESDRLVSASEVERWSYCPAAWKLEREKGGTSDVHTRRGESVHAEVSEAARAVMSDQRSAREAKATTVAFLAMSVAMLGIGISLAFLTSVGDVATWRVVVIVTSVVMVAISALVYFRSASKEHQVIRALVTGESLREMRMRIGFTLEPAIFFFFGLYLLVNGVILLRPFGLSLGSMASFMTVSLVMVYLFLLVFFLIFMRHKDRGVILGRVSLTTGLLVGLLLSITVLFLLVSVVYDIGRIAGLAILTASFTWFIGSLGFHLYRQYRLGSRKSRDRSGTDLPLAVLSMAASVFAASALLSRTDMAEHYSLMSVALALIWLLGAVFFFFRSAGMARRAEGGVRSMGMKEGTKVVDRDAPRGKERGGALVSGRHYLVGKPDLVIEEDGNRVPVEIKSGRAPPKPHFSHEMQLICYMILLETKYPGKVPYGYIEYRPPGFERKRFKVEYDLLTRALALSKVTEIREASRTGEAHRNHHRPGKCQNCPWRPLCPESLA